jgi:hypothetical protein
MHPRKQASQKTKIPTQPCLINYLQPEVFEGSAFGFPHSARPSRSTGSPKTPASGSQSQIRLAATVGDTPPAFSFYRCRRRGPVVRLAISARDRSAALTAAAFGNTSATSGSRTTTFELACSRATYLPRTKVPKSDRLYSGRSASPATPLGFFIDLPLRPGCLASGDDSNCLILFRVSHRQKAPGGLHTKRHKTPLVE